MRKIWVIFFLILVGCTDGIFPEFQSYKFINNSNYSLEFVSYMNEVELDHLSFKIEKGDYHEHVTVVRLGNLYSNIFPVGSLTRMELIVDSKEFLTIKCLEKSPLGYEYCLEMTPEFDFISKPVEKYTVGEKPIRVKGKRVDYWHVYEITDEDIEGLRRIQDQM